MSTQRKPPPRPGRFRWTVVSAVFHIVLVAVLMMSGLLHYRLEAAKKPDSELSEEARQERDKRLKEQQKRRERQRIPREHAEALKKEAEFLKRRRAVERIKRIREDLERLERARDLRTAEIEKRDEESIQTDLLTLIRDRARVFAHEARRNYNYQRRYPGLRAEREQCALLAEQCRDDAEALFAGPDDSALRSGMIRSSDDAHARATANMDAEPKIIDGVEERIVSRPKDRQNLYQAQRLKEVVDRLKDPEKTDPEHLNDLSELSPKSPAQKDPLEKLSTPELYEKARELEKEVNEKFTETTALERAITNVTSYQEARKDVQPPGPPKRPELASELGREPQSISELNEFRKAVDRFSNEMADIERSTENLANQIAGTEGNPGDAELALRMQRALNAAAGQSGRQAIDLAAGMKAVASLGGEGEAGAEDPEFALLGEGGAFMAKVDPRRGVRLPSGEIMANALPARRLSSDATRTGWLYLDTWYAIGPWENGGAIDYERKHPPESVVDFDAVYTNGKADKHGNPTELRWEFMQSNNIRVIPPNRSTQDSTWYFYTEVEAEQDTEVYVALASDDATKAWINDQVIWQENGLSQWSLGEGMRKIFFRRGTNRILLRLENGPNQTLFSILFCPTDAVEK